MIPASFDYAAPTALEEAVSLLASRPDARPIGGGHSLLRQMKLRTTRPSLVVDLRKIESLRGVTSSGDGLTIGAMTTLSEVAEHADVQQSYGALADAIAASSDPQVRNQGTIGGRLANADSGAHLAAAVIALGGRLSISGPNGARTIAAEELATGNHQTSLAQGEIITTVTLPKAAGPSAYTRFRHPAARSAICGVAASVGLRGGKIAGARLAVTGAADRPSRLSAAESALEGKDASGVKAAVANAANGLTCRSDLAASAEYRAYLVAVLAEDAINAAIARA